MCAVLVLAIAYTTGLNLAALSLAAAGLALFGHLQNGRGRAVARVRAAVPGQLLFGLLAAVVRALTHASGVHATIAGVAMGLLMRTRPVGGDRLSPSHRTAPHRTEEILRPFSVEDRFPDFAVYAAAHPGYGPGTTPKQVTAKFFELAKQLDAEPVGVIDGTLFRGVTFERLYAEGLMPKPAEEWQALDQGKPLPTPPPVPENFLASHFYVTCGDSRWPGKVRDYQRNAAIDRLKYPMLGAIGNIKPCAYWPDNRVEPPVQIGDRGPSNVLMAQNERDLGTPLVGAMKLRRAFADRATMVTADQGGHGVYPFGRNTCANNAVTAFLTNGQRLAEDLACAPARPYR
ncbi:alpha/beta hydrolase [Streptomyces telluris]|uniref:alpha/beta hydrolase n=1 Tax=Streptomyces telluris TaxID=2720021 RepID=UPI003556BBE2